MREEEKKLVELRDALKVDPAGDACIELAKILIEKPETRAEAREVLFTGLARDSKHAQARLLLARAFYLDDMLEFSVRELVELKKYSKVPSLNKLLNAFGSFATAYLPNAVGQKLSSSDDKQFDEASIDLIEVEDEEEVLGEIDIDDDFLEALDELED